MKRMSKAASCELLQHGFQSNLLCSSLFKRYTGKYVDCNIVLNVNTSQVSVSWLPKQETDYGITSTYHDITTLIAGTHKIMLEIPILESELTQIAAILALTDEDDK